MKYIKEIKKAEKGYKDSCRETGKVSKMYQMAYHMWLHGSTEYSIDDVMDLKHLVNLSRKKTFKKLVELNKIRKKAGLRVLI